MSNVLAIIPARVGSKGIPGKNFRLLAGRSPVQRAVDVVFEAGIPSLVTSDSEWLQWEFARWPDTWHEANAPLHTDTCSMVDVVLDVLKHYPGPDDQKVLLVQPTQPLREPKHLEQAIAMLDTCDSVASVVEVEPAEKLYDKDLCPVLDWGGTERRQDAAKTYACDGTVYAFRRWWFNIRPAFIGLLTKMMVIPPSETARLDTPFDWEMAELRLKHAAHFGSCSTCK
jgi:CMP-N,N'-diacetyllegionaminic acid synthase